MKIKSGQLVPLVFFVCLISLGVFSQARAKDTSPTLGQSDMIAASTDNEDDEEDEEEEAVDYRDRVREIQQWMNRRDSERKGDAPSLNVAPIAPPQSFPKYFRDNGYDGNGYRRLDSDVRTKLRDAPEATYTHRYTRHHSWHKRWHRHVHPYIHARRHSFRHGYHHSYSHHSHSGGSSRHAHGHGYHHAGKPESHTSRHHGQVSSKHRTVAKTSNIRRSVKAQASHPRPASKRKK